ncbi:hypothetical protein GCM10027612_58270 [Microbispora bryophytorum subsp. camponoti]
MGGARPPPPLRPLKDHGLARHGPRDPGAAELGRTGPFDRWSALRDRIHAQVCDKGYDPERNTFTQSYGSRELDAALLQIPIVGFLPPTTPASSAPSKPSNANS